jgi:tetratricopeptide (TPR) repeat protein
MNAKIMDITDAKFYLQQGLKEEKNGIIRLSYANMFYEKGLRFNPSSLTLIFNLARNYMILNKFKLSIVWFELGLKFKPRWVNGLVGLALTYFEMGYHSRAVVCIKAAHENINLAKNDDFIAKTKMRAMTPS